MQDSQKKLNWHTQTSYDVNCNFDLDMNMMKDCVHIEKIAKKPYINYDSKGYKEQEDDPMIEGNKKTSLQWFDSHKPIKESTNEIWYR